MIARLGRWVDERLDAARFARTSLRKIFPTHWSFLLGEIALYSFVVLVATGIFLTLFFEPSTAATTYDGSYEPLDGVEVSEAYRSALELSFDVRAGLLFRQTHHWAALVFLGAIVVHLSRIFFTGAFRRPREINWLVGLTLLLTALASGFTGYSLLDDLLSGTGLRIAYSLVLSIPLVGDWIASLVFGGAFPTADMIPRFFVAHIFVLPAVLVALLSAHLAILWRQKHTHFPGEGRHEDNVVGQPLWPAYAAKSVGLFALVAAVLVILGAIAQINPVWLYGPYEPAAVTTAAQPDWYIGWLEGALRLWPPWAFEIFGHRISAALVPGIVLPLVTFGILYAWPFLEARVTGDHEEHHLLDLPHRRPVRTAIGAGAITFFVVLTVAGAQDIIAETLNVPIVGVTWTLRVLVLVLPVLAFAVTWRWCRDRIRGDVDEGREESGDEKPATADADYSRSRA